MESKPGRNPMFLNGHGHPAVFAFDGEHGAERAHVEPVCRDDEWTLGVFRDSEARLSVQKADFAAVFGKIDRNGGRRVQ